MGTPESIMYLAFYLTNLREIVNSHDIEKEFVERIIFGILGEIDPGFGGIVYRCDSLITLEGKRIKKCPMSFMKNISIDLALQPLDFLLNHIDLCIRCNRFKKTEENLKLVKNLRNDLIELRKIKKNFIEKCLGEKNCIGREDCPLRSELSAEFFNKILKR